MITIYSILYCNDSGAGIGFCDLEAQTEEAAAAEAETHLQQTWDRGEYDALSNDGEGLKDLNQRITAWLCAIDYEEGATQDKPLATTIFEDRGPLREKLPKPVPE